MVHMPDIGPHILIPGAAIIGIAFAVFLWMKVAKISVADNASDDTRNEYLLEEQRGDAEV